MRPIALRFSGGIHLAPGPGLFGECPGLKKTPKAGKVHNVASRHTPSRLWPASNMRHS